MNNCSTCSIPKGLIGMGSVEILPVKLYEGALRDA